MLDRLFDRLFTSPPPMVVALFCGALLFAAGIVDVRIARDVGVELLYAVPLVIAGWYLDRTWALGFAFVAGAMWLLLETVDPPSMWDPLVSVWNGVTRVLLFGGLAFLVALVHEGMRRGNAMARVDETTGVRNASAFTEATRMEVDRARRTGTALTVAYFDVDGFDDVARVHGTGAGERLLKVIAQSIKAVIRTTDVIARLHDDRFAVLFPDTGRVEAGAVLLKISEQASAGIRETGWEGGLHMAAITFATPPASVNDVRKELEHALQETRGQGRDVVSHSVVA